MATKKSVAEKPAAGEVVAPLLCWRCGKKLAEAAGPGTVIRCRGCGARSRVPELE